ncbi:MAG: hypothetical protein MI717_09155 [Spirochaetales bacterium]|nr:hypothetical protein [Spirochaetales bacterium]
MSGRKLLLIGFVMVAAFELHAQAILDGLRFQPPGFYVGDEVKLIMVFKTESPVALNLPETYPQSDWAEIRDISVDVEEDRLTVTVDFTPFAPGTRTLPPLELGGLRIDGIKVPTHSILDKSYEGVRALRPQLLIPGTRLTLSMVLSALVFVPIFGVRIVRRLIQRISRFRATHRGGRPARRMRRLLRRLKSAIGSTAPALWYGALTDGLREYIGKRLGLDCRSSTTAEISLFEAFHGAQGPQHQILEVLREGDMIKFAGRFADDRRMQDALKTVDSAIKEWEKIHANV